MMDAPDRTAGNNADIRRAILIEAMETTVSELHLSTPGQTTLSSTEMVKLARLHAVIEMMCDTHDIDRETLRRQAHNFRAAREWLGLDRKAFPPLRSADMIAPPQNALWIPEAFYDKDGIGFKFDVHSWHITVGRTDVLWDATELEPGNEPVTIRVGQTVNFLWASRLATISTVMKSAHEWTPEIPLPFPLPGTELIYSLSDDASHPETTPNDLAASIAETEPMPHIFSIKVFAVGTSPVPFTWNGKFFQQAITP